MFSDERFDRQEVPEMIGTELQPIVSHHVNGLLRVADHVQRVGSK